MSQQNVEIAKRAIDAFNRRDLDVADELTTPDFEWFPAMPGAVEGQRYAGREGIEANAAELAETWQDYFVVVEEYHDLGDRVLALSRVRARGASSGVPVDQPMTQIFEFRDGRMSRARTYLDHGEALRAAGLYE